jgi:hypothetical protein
MLMHCPTTNNRVPQATTAVTFLFWSLGPDKLSIWRAAFWPAIRFLQSRGFDLRAHMSGFHEWSVHDRCLHVPPVVVRPE